MGDDLSREIASFLFNVYDFIYSVDFCVVFGEYDACVQFARVFCYFNLSFYDTLK